MSLWSYWTRCRSCDCRLWPGMGRRHCGERVCWACFWMAWEAERDAEVRGRIRENYRSWCLTTLEGALHVTRMGKRDRGEVPEGGTCCENMRELWPARDYMAVGYNVWTPDGFIDPFCPFCSEPLPEDN